MDDNFFKKILIFPVPLHAVIKLPLENLKSKSVKISKIPAKFEETRVELCKNHEKLLKTRRFFLKLPVILKMFTNVPVAYRARIIKNFHP